MKKIYLILVILVYCQLAAYSQPCLPEGITFTTQEQIDSFQVNYPGCTEIEGSVGFGSMSGSNINNLDSLNVLTSIGGSVCFGWKVGTFTGGTGLTDLSGLDNLTSIGEALWIRFHSNLTSLTGLEGLTSIGGELRILFNNNLTDLTGLDNLTSIGGGIEITRNETLTSLMGLNNLTSIGGDLGIVENQMLTSLVGLENINSASIENLTIKENTYLSSCEVISICDYLATPNGTVDIYLNASGCNNPGEIAIACGYPLQCLPYGNYWVWTQSEIDNFQTNYPGCTQLNGGLHIRGNEVTDLAGLNAVSSIGEDLRIRFLNDLTSLAGLEQLTSIGGSLKIEYNDSLTSLTGLVGVNNIGQELRISDNNALTNLSGLDNIDDSSIGSLTIIYNDSLSICEVQSVCNYLADPTGNIAIHENASGCNSQEEVEEACEEVNIDEVPIFINFTISPNPFSQTTIIEFELQESTNVELIIYNHLGVEVYNITEQQYQGHHDINWKAEGLPSGVYFCVLKNNNGIITKKIVKL